MHPAQDRVEKMTVVLVIPALEATIQLTAPFEKRAQLWQKLQMD